MLSHFYVKTINSNGSKEAAGTGWTVLAEELNQMEPDKPTRAFSWRLDGCSEAIKSSRDCSGHGNSSGLNSNRCFMQHTLPSLSSYETKEQWWLNLSYFIDRKKNVDAQNQRGSTRFKELYDKEILKWKCYIFYPVAKIWIFFVEMIVIISGIINLVILIIIFVSWFICEIFLCNNEIVRSLS